MKAYLLNSLIMYLNKLKGALSSFEQEIQKLRNLITFWFFLLDLAYVHHSFVMHLAGYY